MSLSRAKSELIVVIKKNRTIICLLILLFLAFFPRLIYLNKPEGLWFDEMYSFYIANQSFPFEILKKLYTEDYHAPLYFFILHFWMKFFGSSDNVLRLLSAIIGILTIPAIYFLGKTISNRTLGMISAVLLSISSLHIYYSQEVRFYILLVLFSILSSLFCLLILDKPSIKNLSGLVLSNLAILFTFTTGFIYILIQQSVIGLYLFKKKSNSFKKYVISGMLAWLIFLPYVSVIRHQIKSMSDSFIDPYAWIDFNISSIFSIIQNWFSPVLTNIYNNSSSYFFNIYDFEYIVYILIPVLICLFGLFKAIQSQNDKILVLFIINFLFIFFEIIFACLDKTGFLTRYTLIVYPIILLISAYGLLQIKKNTIKTMIFLIFLIVNLSYVLIGDKSVLKIQRIGKYKHISKELMKFNFNKHDILFMPYGGKFFYKYYNNTRVLDLDFWNIFMVNKKEILLNIIDTQTVKQLTRENSKILLKNFLSTKNPTKKFENYFNKAIFDKLPKGRYFIIVSPGNDPGFNPKIQLYSKKENEFYRQNAHLIIGSKIINNFIECSNKKLHMAYYKNIGFSKILVFKKQ